jgi:hypothetical protein
MNKNEAFHPDVLSAYLRGKVKADARQADLQASRDYVIKQGINDLQAKLDRYLKPKP